MKENKPIWVIIIVLGTMMMLCVLPFICNDARGFEIYDNDATPSGAGQDSIPFVFRFLDSLGQPTPRKAANDSLWLTVFYPGGKTVAYNAALQCDAASILASNIRGAYTLFIATAAADGSDPREGWYKWTLDAWDASLNLITPHSGAFYLYDHAEYFAVLDSNTALSRVSTGGKTIVREAVWADTVGTPATGTYARMFKQMYFRNDSTGYYIDRLFSEWRKDRWAYDDPMISNIGISIADFEDSTLWDFSASSDADSVEFWEDQVHFKEGSQGIGMIARSGETAVMRRAITARQYYEGNMTIDVYIDPTSTHITAWPNQAYDDDTSSIGVLVVKFIDSDYGDFAGNYYYKHWSDTILDVGWTPLMTNLGALDSVGNPGGKFTLHTIDSVSIEYTSYRTGAEWNCAPKVTVDDLRFGQRSRAVVVLAFHDADTSVAGSAWSVMKKYRMPGVIWAPGALCSLGTGGKMTKGQMAPLVDDGWMVGNHSFNHLAEGLAYDFEATQRNEIVKGATWVAANVDAEGANFFHYPYDTFDSLTVRILQESGTKLAFGGKRSFAINHPDLFTDPLAYFNYRIPYAPFHATTFTAVNMMAAMDTVAALGNFACFAFHAINPAASSGTSISFTHFQDIIEHLDSLNVNVWTLPQYYEYQVTEQARLARIESNTDELDDSNKTFDDHIWALRDSMTLAYADLDMITNAEVADDIDVDVHTWDGTAAATADDGWATATGFSTHSAADVWTATGGDSVLQSIDYTNNAHHVQRFKDTVGLGTGTAAALAKEATVAAIPIEISDADMAAIGDTTWSMKHYDHDDTTTMGGRLNLAGDTSLYSTATEIAFNVWDYDSTDPGTDPAFGATEMGRYQIDGGTGSGSSPWTAAGVDSTLDVILALLNQLDNDSLSTISARTKAIRDSLQYCVTGSGSSSPWTIAGVDSVFDLALALLNQLDNDSLATLSARAKAIRDSLQYCVTATGFSTHSAADVWTSGTRTLTGTPDVNAIQISGSAATADSLERQLLTGRMLADIKAIDGDTADADYLSAIVLSNQIIAGTRYWWDGSSSAAVSYSSNLPNVNVNTIANGSIDSLDFALNAKKMIAIRADSGAVHRANIVQISGDATAADNMELNYDGTGYDDIGTNEIDSLDFAVEAKTMIAKRADSGAVHSANVVQLGGSVQSVADLKDFADDGYDPAGDTVHTNIATGGAADSASTVRYVKLAAWGISDADGDSSEYAERLIGNSGSSTGLDSTETAAVVAQIVADSNLARDVTKSDYKDGGSGSGAYPCSVLVFDGSDNRAGASVHLANTDTIYNVSTNAAGLSIFNLGEGTYYTYLAYPPYTQDSNPDTLVCTTAGGFDTLFCSGPTIASPPSANLCTIYGWPSIHPTDTLRGAKVTVKSKSTKSWVMDTSTNKVWGQIVIRDSTDYNGRMQINVPKSNYLLPGYNMKYDLIVEKQGYPKIQFEITVPDSTQAHLSSCIKQE